MSQEKNDNNDQEQDISFVEEINDYVPIDSIVSYKVGLYNLFISLLDALTLHYGPVEAVKHSTAFLDQISNTFKNTLPNNEEQQE